MRRSWLGMLVALLLSGCAWGVPDAKPSFPIEYPIEHYVFSDDEHDLALWKLEVRAFRDELRRKYKAEVSAPMLLSSSREEEFLDRAVDPERLLWRDPRLFFKAPIILSWWEVIDERGRVQQVFVVTSNQTREADARILAWCANNKLWRPGELDGSAAATIRSASINLGESKFHVYYWQKRVGPSSVIFITLGGITLVVWFVRSATRRRRDRRLRHEALMRHVAHHPYQAPSIDDEPKL